MQLTDQLFVKGYVFSSFPKNLGKDIGKRVVNKVKNVLIMLRKKSATDGLKTTFQRVIQKTEEATGDLIDNKIANKITKVSKNSQQNNSETVKNENDKKIFTESHISQKNDRKLLIH